MEEIEKIAGQLLEQSETFKTLAASAEPSREVRLPPSTVDGLTKRFAQMSASPRKIGKASKPNDN